MKHSYTLLWILIILVAAAGLCFPLVQGSDANEYASIATQMFYRNDWVNIINHDPLNGAVYDYLDKPHLLFWSAMAGYKLFGVGAFGYRFFSVLLCFFAGYGVFRLGTLVYNKATGKLAAVFFMTAQAVILANHDVKTDTLLTSFIALALWQFVAFVKERNLINMIWGAAFLAGGVGTKGMIAVLVTGCIIFFYILGQKNWKAIFTWKWVAGIAAFFFFLSPVLYCYHLQFDHPVDFVNGGHATSGIEFLLWSQSFSRFAGQRALYPEFSFFFHTFLWAFLPWSVIAYYGTFHRIKELIQTKGRSFFTREQLGFSGLWVMFLLMSLSKFKLPHYLNVLLPVFAVFTAGFIMQLWEEKKEKLIRVLTGIQWGIIFLSLLMLILLNTWAFPVKSWWVILITTLLIIYILLLFFKQTDSAVYRLWYPSAISALALNFMLNANFYPAIGIYQNGSSMALAMKEKGIDPQKVYNYAALNHAFDFYTKRWQPILTDDEIAAKKRAGEDVLIYASKGKKDQVEKRFATETLLITPDKNIAGLSIKFINPATRAASYSKEYLLRIK